MAPLMTHRQPGKGSLQRDDLLGLIISSAAEGCILASWCDFKLSTLCIQLTHLATIIANATSLRTRKPTKRAKAQAETGELVNEICDLKVARKRKRDALQPIALEPLAACQLCNEDLSDHHPPLRLRKFHPKPLLHPQIELEAFRVFITHDIIGTIVSSKRT